MAKYSDASKFTAAYYNGTGQYSYSKFLLDDPIIGEMGLIPYTQEQTTNQTSALNEAIKLVGFMTQYRFDLHEDKTLQSCIDSVAKVILDKKKKASDISKKIDETFVFLDEVQQ